MKISMLSYLAMQALLLPRGLAFDPATDRGSCEPNHPCLTSFIWCAMPGRDAVDSGCSYPPKAYPLYNRGEPANPALLLATQRYTVSWKGTDSQYPVMVEWFFNGAPWLNATDDDPGVRGRWSQNITGTNELSLNFGGMMKDFPTTLSDLNPAEASGLSSDIDNYILITQPDRPLPPNVNASFYTPYTYWLDRSDRFSIASDWVERFIDADREIQSEIESARINRRWRLGVGIGVGLGVPILMVAAFFGGWKFGSKRAVIKDISESKKMSSSS